MVTSLFIHPAADNDSPNFHVILPCAHTGKFTQGGARRARVQKKTTGPGQKQQNSKNNNEPGSTGYKRQRAILYCISYGSENIGD